MQKQILHEPPTSMKLGSLKIYLGYAAGVGKTYSMLQEGHRLQTRGLDVVIGDVKTKDRPDTISQVKNLEINPKRFYTIGDQSFEEMDLNTLLARKPQYVLIDDLAHRNSPGTKNTKRFQDILEILSHEINVITTINIENLESVADRISNLFPSSDLEKVPDFVFQRADQIIHVDISIEELRERIRSGTIFQENKIEDELRTRFSTAALSVLREAALKETAGNQIRKIQEQSSLYKKDNTARRDSVMVALSSDPNNAEILIRKGTRLASRLSGQCYVVYVQKKSENPNSIDPQLLQKLQENMQLANSLGAEVITIPGESVSESLVGFAHENRVRHAVLGKSRLSPLRERLRGSVILSFIHDTVGIDVHIVSMTEGEERCH
jgi:two-component system sensor histidine kinase KdpD